MYILKLRSLDLNYYFDDKKNFRLKNSRNNMYNFITLTLNDLLKKFPYVFIYRI